MLDNVKNYFAWGLFFKKLNTPPFWQNEAKFTNDFKDRAADL